MLANIPNLKSVVFKLSARSFASTAAATNQAPAADPTIKGDQNIFKGQHVRYIPKKRLQFGFASPEGPLALIYEASDAYYKRANNWKLSTAAALPAAGLAYYSLGAAYMWAYPMLFLPAIFNLYDFAKLHFIVYKTEVRRMWLYQNGDQVLVQTYDGMLHRMNIIDNNEHEIVENKDHLVFVMNNSGREYLLSNKDCKVIDYDLVDRLIKGIRVDTLKFQKLYNRLLYRQTPINLRPSTFNRFIPQAFDLKSNRTIWKLLNRTIYRDDDNTWLRN
jgi:hypothetical protein